MLPNETDGVGEAVNRCALWFPGTITRKPGMLWMAQLRALVLDRGKEMKKVVLALVLVVAGVSLGGCFVGKAPAPVITKG